MATLSTVAVDFVANTGKYVQGLSQMSNTTKKWANDTKKDADNAGNSLGSLGGGIGRLGGLLRGGAGLAAGFGIAGTALATFAKKAIDSAGKLSDLSYEVNISTQNLQRLESIFGKSGVTLDQVVSKYTKLEKAAQDAADGNLSLLRSFAELGINVDSFNKLSEEQKIETFAKALSQIQDPARKAAIAIEILGKDSRKFLQGLQEIADKLSIEKAADDVFVNSDKVIKALDGVGDSFDVAGEIAFRFGKEILGLVVAGFQSTVVDAKKAGKAVEEYVKTLEDRFLPILDLLKKLGIDKPSETFFKGPQLPVPEIIIPEEVAERAKKTLAEAKEAQDQINDIFLSSVDPAAKYRVELRKLNKEAEKAKIPPEILAIRQAALKKEFEEATKKIEENRRELELNAQSEERVMKAKFGLLQTSAGGTSQFAAPSILPTFFTPGQQAQLDLAEKRIKDVITFPSSPEAIKADADQQKRGKLFTEEYNRIKQVSVGLIESAMTAEDVYRKRVTDINLAAAATDEYGNSLITVEQQTYLLGEAQKQLQQATLDVWEKANPQIMQAFELMSGFADSFSRAIVEGQNFGDALKNVFKDVLRQITLLIIRTAIIQAIMASIGLVNPVAAASFGQLTGLIPRARGGPVMAGEAYRVGESGPETFVPTSNGYILPNEFQGGGEQVIVNQTINIQTGVAQTVRAEMFGLLPRFKQEAMAGVLDAKQRGGSYAKGLAVA